MLRQNQVECLAVIGWWKSNRSSWVTLKGKGAPMNSTPDPTATEPNHVIMRADEQLARAHEQIASAVNSTRV
jgi:hypothetical protein